LFGWRIQPESASHNSIFLSREISQLFSQTVFSSHAKSASQPASQPAEQAVNSNPHADPAEDTLYRILSRNGCAPELVELNKEIRGMIAGWRSALKKAWANQSEVDGSSWNDDCRILQEQIRQINDKVFRYNLIVPFGRQMFGLNWEKVDKLKSK